MLLPRHYTDCLPIGSTNSKPTRWTVVFGAAGFTFLLSALYVWRRMGNWHPQPVPLPPVDDSPPLYADFHNAELQLPQHDWSKTRPGDGEKFFFVAGHTRGLGWGNAFQEHLMNGYLAYRAGRTFVFGNYTWRDDGSVYSDWNGHRIPSQIPYSAFVRGPIVGKPFPRRARAPSAVSKEYFDHVCPTKRELVRDEVHANLTSKYSAELVTDAWVYALRHTEDPCVEESRESGPIYIHYEIWGRREALRDIWPSFSTSPIITQFGWSSLVESAFDSNRGLLVPRFSPVPKLADSPYATGADRYSHIPGLMAIHVRRGDYEEHCQTLAHNSDDFVGVTNFEEMLDQFTVPVKGDDGETTPENIEHYRQRCYPTVDEIVKKVMDVRRTAAGWGTRHLYIMTNGHPEFIQELKDALSTVAEWDVIASSRDLELTWEQKFIAQAVDMLIAQRAQVFVGNGFSTLTSTAVMMRLANGFPTDSNRFW